MLRNSYKLFYSCLLVGIFFISGCQAAMYGTAEDFNSIALGMNKEAVIAKLGQPMTRGADAVSGEETLTYKRMAYTLGWSPTMYDVVLKDGKVVRFGVQK